MPNALLLAEFERGREAQQRWSDQDIKARVRTLKRVRHLLAENAALLASSVSYPQRSSEAETLSAELIPLADACRFLESQAPRILARRRLSRRQRPMWQIGVSVELHREPLGIVLIVGASNFPLFLPGVQMLQALVAGNAVFVKPGAGSTSAMRALVDLLSTAGMDPSLVHVLPEHPKWVRHAVEAGVSKVFLTGSAHTGRALQSLLAESLIPATMELSGCDAVFIIPGADLDRVVRSLVFGLRLNGSATCIAPRRVFVPSTMKAELELRLCREIEAAEISMTTSHCGPLGKLVAEAIRDGARAMQGGLEETKGSVSLAAVTVLSDTRAEMSLLRSEVFAPVLSLVPVASTAEALQANDQCPYALGATIFGPVRESRELARRVNAGCVVINDMIAPTADPRVPFGGRKQSGFGVTRGAAGLEEMTRLKAVLQQRRRWLPHLDQPSPFDANLLTGYLETIHGRNWQTRLRGARRAVQAAVAQRRWKQKEQDRRQDDEKEARINRP